MPIKLKFGDDFLCNLPLYQRHADFIDGSVQRVAKYLTKQAAEEINTPVKQGPFAGRSIGSVLWEKRNQRLANENLVHPILMHWQAHLSQEINKSDVLNEDPWDSYLANINGQKLSLERFRDELIWQYEGFGRVGVLVEGPRTRAETELEARARNERSFAQVYEAHEILKCSKITEIGPDIGKISELILFTGLEKVADKWHMKIRRFLLAPAIDEAGEITTRYTSQEFIAKRAGNIYADVNGTFDSAHQSEEWKGEIEFVETAEEALGAFDEIPFVIIGTGIDESTVKDVVADNREHLNKKSAFDSINYAQAFKRIAAFGVKPEELSVWTEHLIAVFDNEKGHIDEVEPGDPVALKQDIDKIERRAFLKGTLRFGMLHADVTKQVQSADSKRLDNQTFEEALETDATTLEDALQAVINFMWRFENGEQPSDDVNISLERDFLPIATEEELAEDGQTYFWAGDFKGSGDKLKAEIVAKRVAQMRFAASREDSDLKRADIIEGLRAEAEAGLQQRSLNQNSGVATPEGRLSVSQAIAAGND